MNIAWADEYCGLCQRALDIQDINFVEDHDYVLAWVGCLICGCSVGRVLVVKNDTLEMEL